MNCNWMYYWILLYKTGISANSQEALSMFARFSVRLLDYIYKIGISANSQEALSMYARFSVRLLDYIV